jgi:hypothetical protein
MIWGGETYTYFQRQKVNGIILKIKVRAEDKTWKNKA